MVFTLIPHYDTLKKDEALEVCIFQIIRNFNLKNFCILCKPVLTGMCWQPLLQGEKRSVCIPTYKVQHLCASVFSVLVFYAVIRERKHTSLFLHE